MAAGKKSSNNPGFLSKIKSIIFSTQGFPLFLSFTSMAVLFVLFRMKNVEMDYRKVLMDNKELKAKNARMLSTDKLRKLAFVHHLDQPKQDQIIVIP